MNNTTPIDEKRWFGIKLSQTAKVILFYLSLIGIIEYSNILGWINSIATYIYIYGFPSVMLSAQIFGVIMQVIVIIVSGYTLSICFKSRNVNIEIQNNEGEDNDIRWFGFALSRTSTIILFFLAIIGICTIAYSLYFQIVNFGSLFRYLILYGPPDLMDILNLAAWLIVFNMLISRIVINSYSMQRFFQARRNLDLFLLKKN